MAQVIVTVSGASRQALLTWKSQPKALGGAAPNFATTFPEQRGPAVYAIVVFGNPADPWTATVTDGTTTFSHAGHMSDGGHDGTGDTTFPVS